MGKLFNITCGARYEIERIIGKNELSDLLKRINVAGEKALKLAKERDIMELYYKFQEIKTLISSLTESDKLCIARSVK